jgi:hypothetical protein
MVGIGIGQLGDREQAWIVENGARQFERDAVLAFIDGRLGIIPLELQP